MLKLNPVSDAANKTAQQGNISIFDISEKHFKRGSERALLQLQISEQIDQLSSSVQKQSRKQGAKAAESDKENILREETGAADRQPFRDCAESSQGKRAQ